MVHMSIFHSCASKLSPLHARYPRKAMYLDIMPLLEDSRILVGWNRQIGGLDHDAYKGKSIGR